MVVKQRIGVSSIGALLFSHFHARKRHVGNFTVFFFSFFFLLAFGIGSTRKAASMECRPFDVSWSVKSSGASPVGNSSIPPACVLQR